MEEKTESGRLYSVSSSWRLQSQSCSNIERKCQAKQGLVIALLLCVTEGGVRRIAGYLLEGSMCLSLNDQSSSISYALSLPVYHTERRAALICFRRRHPTQDCLYSSSNDIMCCLKLDAFIDLQTVFQALRKESEPL